MTRSRDDREECEAEAAACSVLLGLLEVPGADRSEFAVVTEGVGVMVALAEKGMAAAGDVVFETVELKDDIRGG